MISLPNATRWAIATSVILVVSGSVAHACGTHGTVAGNDIRAVVLGDTDGDGLVEAILAIQDTFIAPTSATVCTAGVGLGTTALPLAGGVAVNELKIVRTNLDDGTSLPLDDFSFLPSSAATSGLAAGSGSTGAPETNPLFEGATWFGFASPVEPFTLPELGPNEIFEMEFHLTLPQPLLPLMSTAQFAGGQGEADGTPIFTGDHPLTYFTSSNPSITLEPLPLPGDGNGDRWVDGLDYLLWAGAYGTHPSPDGDISDGDYDDDGWVDGLDYLLWAGNYGAHSAATVPEPSSLILLLVSGLTTLFRRRR